MRCKPEGLPPAAGSAAATPTWPRNICGSSTRAVRGPDGLVRAWTMAGMRFAEKIVVHQVHPAKIGADVTASALSNILLWNARPKPALAARILLPVAGSVAVLKLADLDALAKSRRGQYVRAHMPASAQAVRLAGDAVMGLGAHRRSTALVLAGAIVIVAGWSQAAWPQTSGRT
jgi:hypothetical protein